MTEITPTHIAVHQQSRLLEIHFSDDSQYQLSFEYLRVFSPSAEVRAAKNRGEIIRGKQDVMITGVEPVGNYAVRLQFDDGHDSGIYSWTTLHKLAHEQERNWSDYQQQLHDARKSDATDDVTVLMFMQLAERLGSEKMSVQLSASITTVGQLLEHLQQRGESWREQLDPQHLTITVNKQFADSDQRLFPADEVALVPRQTQR